MTIKSIYKEREIEIIKERWDKKATDWDKNLEDKNHHLNLDNAYDNFIVIAKDISNKIQSRNKALDLACGTGIISENISQYFNEVIGIDISSEMINEAKNKQISNATFLQLDCFNLDRINGKFDLITSRGIILSHYGKKLAIELLNSLKDKLNKDGCIILDFLNSQAKEVFDYKVDDKEYYSRNEIIEICEKIGYSNIIIHGEEENRVLVACIFNN